MQFLWGDRLFKLFYWQKGFIEVVNTDINIFNRVNAQCGVVGGQRLVDMSAPADLRFIAMQMQRVPRDRKHLLEGRVDTVKALHCPRSRLQFDEFKVIFL